MNTAIEINKRLEMPKTELAKALGVTRARVSQLCSQENLRTDNFEKILDVLGYDLLIVKRDKSVSGEVPNPLENVDDAYFLNDSDIESLRAFAVGLVQRHKERLKDEKEQERLAEWNRRNLERNREANARRDA